MRVNSVVHFPWHRLRKQAVLFHVDWRRWDAVEPLRDRAKTGSVVLLVRFPELQRFMSWLLIYWTCSSVCHDGTQPEIYFWQDTAQPFILCGRPSLGHESSQLTSPTLTRQLEKAGSVSSAGHPPMDGHCFWQTLSAEVPCAFCKGLLLFAAGLKMRYWFVHSWSWLPVTAWSPHFPYTRHFLERKRTACNHCLLKEVL